jgi:hypothetical protein
VEEATVALHTRKIEKEYYVMVKLVRRKNFVFMINYPRTEDKTVPSKPLTVDLMETGLFSRVV